MSEKRQRQVTKRKSRKLRPPPQWITNDPNRLIDIHELTHLSGSKAISTTYDWITAGVLPEGIKLTGNSRRWRYGDIIEALKKLAEQDAA